MIKVADLYPVIIETINQGKTFKMPIRGTSMIPLLHTNDVVELSKIDSINKNDIIFYKRADGSFVLHRVYKVLDNKLIMVGDHQVVLEEITKDMCFAKVVSYTKNNKTYYLKGFRYKLYLLTLKSFLIRRFYGKCLK